ncbi:hypothetical protein [Sphingomonas oryzagri]
MADRVSASITIGGALDADRYAELANMIAAEGLSIEWDGEPFETHHRTIGEPLTLHALEVAWGYFSDLEAWCVSVELPFVCWSGGYPTQWGPSRVIFRGTGEPETYTADEDEQVILCRETIERLGSYAAIIAYFEAADFEPPVLWVTGDPGTPVSNIVVPALPTEPDPSGAIG